MRLYVLALLTLAGLLFGVACSDEDNPLASASQGTIAVNLHDQPSPTVLNAMMTVDSVTLTAADGTLYPLESAQLDTPFDLAQLTGGNQVNLGVEPVPAGDYVQLTLVVSALDITLTDTTVVPVIQPASSLSVQLPLSLTVAPGEDVVLGVDFPLTAIGFDGTNWTVDGSAVALD